MPDRLGDLVAFMWEIGLPTKRLKKIRVGTLLYHDLLLHYRNEDIPVILHDGKPYAFLMAIPVDCDPTIPDVAFEFDYAS